MAGKGKKVNKVRYLSEKNVAAEMGLTEELVHSTFEVIRMGYSKLQIKNKTGRLVWQSASTTQQFVELARSIEDGTCDPSRVKAEMETRRAPKVTVPVMEFAKACEKSIADGRNIVPLTGNNCRKGLMRFLVEVEAGGTVAHVRLDLACALVKRMSRLPYDAYGDVIAGAMTDRDGRRWIIAYDLSEQLTPCSPNAANIDHLIPRAAGGSSSLCNLHVMRLHDNSSKSDIPMPDISGEPQESIAVLSMLSRGCRKAALRGEMDEVLSNRIQRVIRHDLITCLDMLPAGKVIATLARGFAGRLAGTRGDGGPSHAMGRISVHGFFRNTLTKMASSTLMAA